MSMEAVIISFIFSLYAETTETKSCAQINEETRVKLAQSAQPQEVLDILTQLKIGEPKT